MAVECANTHEQFFSRSFDNKSYSFIAIPDDYRDERSSMSYARSLCDFTTSSSCPPTVNQSLRPSVRPSVHPSDNPATAMVVPVALPANKDIIQLEVQIPARLAGCLETHRLFYRPTLGKTDRDYPSIHALLVAAAAAATNH